MRMLLRSRIGKYLFPPSPHRTAGFLCLLRFVNSTPRDNQEVEGRTTQDDARKPIILIDTFPRFCYTDYKRIAVNHFGFRGQHNPADAVPNFDKSGFLTVFRAGDGCKAGRGELPANGDQEAEGSNPLTQTLNSLKPSCVSGCFIFIIISPVH